MISAASMLPSTNCSTKFVPVLQSSQVPSNPGRNSYPLASSSLLGFSRRRTRSNFETPYKKMRPSLVLVVGVSFRSTGDERRNLRLLANNSEGTSTGILNKTVTRTGLGLGGSTGLAAPFCSVWPFRVGHSEGTISQSSLAVLSAGYPTPVPLGPPVR